MNEALAAFYGMRLSDKEGTQRAKALLSGGPCTEDESVLGEVNAGRVILRMYALAGASSSRLITDTLCEVIKVLASAYASHPDWHQDWWPGE